MSVVAKTYLDLTGLNAFKTLMQTWANSENQVAYKTILKSADGNTLNLYKKAGAVLGTDTPDATISLGGGDLQDQLDALASIAGATWVPAAGNVAGHYTIDLDNTFDVSTVDIVDALNEHKGQINTLNGSDSTSGSVAKSIKDAVEGLDVSEFALASVSNDVVTIKGIKEVDGEIAIGDGAGISLEEVAYTGAAEDVSYDNTTSGLTATDAQGALDEIVDGLGTAAAANVATSAIQEESTDDGLVSAAQVATFVASEISGLVGAMHFRGVITRQTGETDAQAIARVITDPEAGDVVVMSDNAKEYIYESSTIGWKEVGDETEFVKKTTTIAGVDLEDNITKTELLTALNVEDGAEVNIIESVQVNGSALTPDGNRAVNVTVATGTADGTIAVNGSDVSVAGLGSAAYADTTDFEAAGAIATAVAALDTSNDVAIASYDSTTETITLVNGISESDGIIGAGTGDGITISPIATTDINALFNPVTP